MAMLPEIYIEALLVDTELADQVWEAWDKGEILMPMFEFNLTHFWPQIKRPQDSSGSASRSDLKCPLISATKLSVR